MNRVKIIDPNHPHYVDPRYIEHLDIVIEPEACGYHCHQTEKYGFVPEAGCPVHDVPLTDGKDK